MKTVGSSQPDVFVVVADSLRVDAVSAATMPNMVDRFDADWLAYPNAYANAPWSLPSHASIFTGKLPREHGATAHNKYLSPDDPTLAELFREHGYDTQLISNNAFLTESFGMTRGFADVAVDLKSKLLADDTDLWISQRLERAETRREAVSEFLRDSRPQTLVNLGYKFAKRFLPSLEPQDDGARQSIRYFFEGTRSDLTFTVFNFMEPHLPYLPPTEYVPADVDADAVAQNFPDQTWRYLLDDEGMDFEGLWSLYEGEIRYLDRQIDRMMQRLEADGRLEESIVVVCGDHGDHFGEHRRQGHVASTRSELLHVPLFVRLPSGKHGDETVETTVSLRQLFPSLLDWADLPDCGESGLREPLPTVNEADGVLNAALGEYFGIQYIDAPADVYERFDVRETALATAGEYHVSSGDGADDFQSDDGVYAKLTQGTTDRTEEFTDQRSLDDATKNQLEAMGYVG